MRSINTGAQKSMTKLGCHFSYISKQFWKFVETGHNVVTENEIYEALRFDGGVSKPVPLLVDFSLLALYAPHTRKFNFISPESNVRDVRCLMDRNKFYL